MWKREVKGGAPSTLRDNEALLREPGTPFKRGGGVSEGRIMKRFGDQPIETVTTREVSAFLRQLDRSGMPPRNVNKHRALLHAIFAYATREDTHGLAANPVSGTDTRYEPPATPLDHYEVDEVEALARVCEQGGHRGARNYRGRSVEESEAELAARTAEDQQDAAFFRVLFFSGLRLGEALALRWRHVMFLPDLTGAVIDVRRAVSAGVEKEPKGRRPRQVPLPAPPPKPSPASASAPSSPPPTTTSSATASAAASTPQPSAAAPSAPPQPPASAPSSSTASATPPAPSSPARCRS